MEVLQNFKNLFFDVWNKGISGINISEIIIALLIFLFFLFLRGVFSKFVVKRLENYVSKSTNNFDNSLVFSMEGPAKFFPVVLGFFVSTSYLTVETQAAEFLETINRSLITILIFWTFHQIIGPFSVVIKSKKKFAMFSKSNLNILNYSQPKKTIIDLKFLKKRDHYFKHYLGGETPFFKLENLTRHLGGAQI